MQATIATHSRAVGEFRQTNPVKPRRNYYPGPPIKPSRKTAIIGQFLPHDAQPFHHYTETSAGGSYDAQLASSTRPHFRLNNPIQTGLLAARAPDKKKLPLQRRRLSARVRCVRSSGWGGGFRLKTHSCTSPHHGEEAARNAGRATVILPWEVCCICFRWPVESRSALCVLRDASISLRRAVTPLPRFGCEVGLPVVVFHPGHPSLLHPLPSWSTSILLHPLPLILLISISILHPIPSSSVITYIHNGC